jgi:transcriptional regulator with XRE-family HTH domain
VADKHPFAKFGSRIRQLREQAQESLADVSGAVEIDTDMLTSIEDGLQQPPEDIVVLLINHFGIKEDEAVVLWELAGYDQERTPYSNMVNSDETTAEQAVMVMPLDARIVYTDMVHVMVNNYGVVMNFMQGAGPNNKPLAVTRIGMSREHAKSVLKVLQETLDMSDQQAASAEDEAAGNAPETEATSES